MRIRVGSISADNRKLDKGFTGGTPFNDVATKHPCSVINPTFILKRFGGFADCNYLYCEDFGRYYYINNITVLEGGRIQLDCTVDVLYTYKSAIEAISAYIERSSNGTANYLADSNIPLDSRTTIQNLQFTGGNSFGDGYYVLTVLGAIGNG